MFDARTYDLCRTISRKKYDRNRTTSARPPPPPSACPPPRREDSSESSRSSFSSCCDRPNENGDWLRSDLPRRSGTAAKHGSEGACPPFRAGKPRTASESSLSLWSKSPSGSRGARPHGAAAEEEEQRKKLFRASERQEAVAPKQRPSHRQPNPRNAPLRRVLAERRADEVQRLRDHWLVLTRPVTSRHPACPKASRPPCPSAAARSSSPRRRGTRSSSRKCSRC